MRLSAPHAFFLSLRSRSVSFFLSIPSLTLCLALSLFSGGWWVNCLLYCFLKGISLEYSSCDIVLVFWCYRTNPLGESSTFLTLRTIFTFYPPWRVDHVDDMAELSTPLDMLHFGWLPSPLTGCLLAKMRREIRNKYFLRDESCNDNFSPCCFLVHTCCIWNLSYMLYLNFKY